MRIGPDHEPTRKGIIFQDHLVDDTGPWFPEANPVFIGNRREKIINLFVFVYGFAKVRCGPCLGLDQVIAMHRAGHRHRGPPRLHELQQSHLGGCILHGHTIRSEIYIINPPS